MSTNQNAEEELHQFVEVGGAQSESASRDTIAAANFVRSLRVAFVAIGATLLIANLATLNLGIVSFFYTVTGTWMSLFAIVFSAGPALLTWLPPSSTCSCCACCACCHLPSGLFWTYYHHFTAAVSALLVLGWFVGRRPDGGVWSLFLLLISVVNVLAESRPVPAPLLSTLANKSPCAGAFASTQPLQETARPNSSRTRLSSALLLFTTATLGVAPFLYALQLGGSWLQAVGYSTYAPRGSFYTVKLQGGAEQVVHARCVGPSSSESTRPTMWVEVGGGGHSMSDLWGIEAVLSAPPYNLRYCSYDVPGTAHSPPYADGGSLLNMEEHVYLSERVMEAMGVTEDVICLGNMDMGDQRCLLYCKRNPGRCRAIVPVSFGGSSEFYPYAKFYGGGESKERDMVVMSSSGRKDSGNLVNFFGVSWGIISAIVANPTYEPKNLARESLFLNLMNEKQWLVNSNVNAYWAANPSTAMGPSLWEEEETFDTQSTIPVFGFTQGMTDEQLDQQCRDWMYSVNSKDCDYLRFVYEETVRIDLEVVARNAASRLVLCFDECKDSGGSFFLNQGALIPWFAQTLWGFIKDL